MKKVAFIFPGQGSQSVGMGKDFYENSQIAKEMIKKASDRIGVNFEELLFEENEKLNQTEFTQPAILLVSAIAYEIFKSKCDVKPEFVLGHSLGEFSALVVAGGIDYLDAIELTHKRGQFMSDACDGIGAGMMALLGLDDSIVEKVCEEQRTNGKQVWAANYNTDGQVVLAGSKSDLESLVDVFKDAGAKRAIVLPMSVASHCPILEPAISKLAPYLENINSTFRIPVISNATTKPYNTKDEAITLLSNQLIMPVLYKQSIQAHMSKVDMFIEFGNGNVLKGLNKKGVDVPTLCVNDMNTLEEVINEINA
ncbi:MAG: ACP S-malonyltransferase [Arcobacteraceae bacterium]|jgi:[acyl-carrier-protein] S-malonyltransferase